MGVFRCFQNSHAVKCLPKFAFIVYHSLITACYRKYFKKGLLKYVLLNIKDRVYKKFSVVDMDIM